MTQELHEKKCAECSIGGNPLSPEEVSSYMDLLSDDWEVVDNHHLRRVFKFKNFRQALDYTNKIGELAEEEQHHPDLELSWGRVVVTLFTHKIGGISESDIVFAAKIDKLD